MALVVQARRRDDAEQPLQRGKGRRVAADFRQAAHLAALQRALMLRGQAVGTGGDRLANTLRPVGQVEDRRIAFARPGREGRSQGGGSGQQAAAQEIATSRPDLADLRVREKVLWCRAQAPRLAELLRHLSTPRCLQALPVATTPLR